MTFRYSMVPVLAAAALASGCGDVMSPATPAGPAGQSSAQAPPPPTNGRAVFNPTWDVFVSWDHPGGTDVYYTITKSTLDGSYVPSNYWPAVASWITTTSYGYLPADAKRDRTFILDIRACRGSNACSAPNQISVGVPRIEPPVLFATAGPRRISLRWIRNSPYGSGALLSWSTSTGVQYRMEVTGDSLTFENLTPGVTFTFTMTNIRPTGEPTGGVPVHGVTSEPVSATPYEG